MIIKEFLGNRMAPLRAHSHPLWEFTACGDPIRMHVSGLTHDKLDGVLAVQLGPCPEDLPHSTPQLYARDDMLEMVAGIPAFDEWAIIGPQKDCPITVLSSGGDKSDQDSEPTKGEVDTGRTPPPDLHPSLYSLGDDTAANERCHVIALSPRPQGWSRVMLSNDRCIGGESSL
ncbi:hypothetical protein D1007_53129 [Hordeum vulgare]|nr:hypothetical protein D1007_53129 [Hordeum vulgare]